MITRQLSAFAHGLFGLSLVGLVWYLVTAFALVPRAFLPSPLATWNALMRGLLFGDTASQFAGTVTRMLQGWLLASVVAIALGCVIGMSASARTYLRPMLAFLRALPASATLPIAIAFVGLSPSMVVGVITFGSLWPTLLATVQGFAMVEPRLYEVARAMHLSKLAFVWKIGLPNALSDILTGMRLSLTVALILAVIGEMLAAQPGIGQAILLAARSFRAPELYAGILLLGLIGALSTFALALVERRLLRWK